MTYRKLLYKATILINKGEITLGEYEEMTKPLDREVEQESILDKIRAEIIEMRSRQNVGVLECLDIIDKYKAESEDKL